MKAPNMRQKFGGNPLDFHWPQKWKRYVDLAQCCFGVKPPSEVAPEI